MNFNMLSGMQRMVGQRRGGGEMDADEYFSQVTTEFREDYDGWLKTVKYEESMRGKWNMEAVKMCFQRVHTVCKESKYLPAKALVLGAASSQLFAAENGDKNWYCDQCERLLTSYFESMRDGSHVPDGLENTLIAFNDCMKNYGVIIEQMALDTNPSNPVRRLPFLGTAIDVLQNGRTGRLTAAHKTFAWICVEYKYYHTARGLVNQVIVEVVPGLQSMEYLGYFYYAGLTHIALKNYASALDHFSMCQIVPGDQTSLIQIDAHKKYILVSLILHGKVIELPQFVSPRLNRAFSKACSAYLDLEGCFDGEENALNERITQNADQYMKDHNWGLVSQLRANHEITRVRKLKNVYASCSLEVAALQGKIADSNGDIDIVRTKRIVQHLISSGEFQATLDANGIITFADQSRASSRYRVLSSQLAEAMQLTQLAEEIVYKTMTSEEYIAATTPQLHATNVTDVEDMSAM